MKRILFLFLLPLFMLSACGAVAPTAAEVDSAVLAAAEENHWADYTCSIAPVDDARWDVTLTFWIDTWAQTRPTATTGYSQSVLRYEKTQSGWQFSDLSTAAPNLKADTVYFFTYDDAHFSATNFDRYSDIQLALYLLHSDGALTEGPSDLLYRRFTNRPAQILSVLAGLRGEWQAQILPLIAGAAAYWYPDDDFAALLDGLTPENDGEADVIDQLRTQYAKGQADEHRVTPYSNSSLDCE